MAESITHVIYEALADFSSLHTAAAGAIADLDAIKRKEAEVNAASASGSRESAAARDADTASMQKQQGFLNGIKDSLSGLFRAQKDVKTSTDASTKGFENQNKVLKDAVTAQADAKKATKDLKSENDNLLSSFMHGVDAIAKTKDANLGLVSAFMSGMAAIAQHKKAVDEDTKSVKGFRAALRKTIKDLTDADVIARRASTGFDYLGGTLQKILGAGNGRGGMAPLMLLVPLISGILAVVNPVVAGIGAIGGALFGLISNLSTLVGLLAVVPGSILAFVSSLGVLRLSFSGIGTALKDYQAAQQAASQGTKAHTAALKTYEDQLKKLSPAAQTFVKWLVSMQGSWQNFKNSISQSFFSAFVGDLSKVSPLFQLITTVMDKAAGAVGGVVSQFLRLMQTTGAQNGLALFGDQNAKLISTVGSGLLSILDTIGKLTVAAGPFTQLVAEGLARAADSLDRIVSKASSDGSLEAWLTHVYSNLQLWWGIVSNIAKTIFNYGRAASSFGTWITQGLKDVTDGWEKASEAALKPGSTFKQWLEDIKPLVSELSSIIGSFLTWWNQTATDKSNITTMLTMLKDINDHLGPALGDLLKTMGRTSVGPDLIKFITTVVQMVDTIMSNGGAEVLQGVIHFLTELASFINDVASVPGVAPTLMTIATALSMIAALSFVNKFIPLISAIAWLLRLADAEGPITKVFNALAGYKGSAAKAAADAAGGAAEDVAAGAAAGGLLGKLSGGAGKFLKGGLKGAGGIPGILASLGGQLAGGAISGAAPRGTSGADQRVWGNALSGASSGAGTGAFIGGSIGSFIPGLGTGIGGATGAVVGGTVGGVSGILNSDPADRKKWGQDTVSWGNHNAKVAKGVVTGAFTAPLKGAQVVGDSAAKAYKVGDGAMDSFNLAWVKALDKSKKQISVFFSKTVPDTIKSAGKHIWDGLVDASKWLSDQNKKFVSWFKNLPHNIGVAAKYLWNDLQDIGTWLDKQWKALVKWCESLPDKVGKAAGDFWSNVQTIQTWLLKQETKAYNWFKSLPGKIASWVGDAWRNVQTIQTWLLKQETKAYNWFVSLPGKIASWVGNTFRSMKGIGSWIADQAASLARWVASIPGQIASGFAGAGNPPQGHHGGGMIYRASGGWVPGEGDEDTVHAMLTPGEIVINKKVVNAVGAQNLLNLNSGFITLSEMLNHAMASSQSNKSKGSAYPDFLSGAGLSSYSSAVPRFNSPSASMFNSNSSSVSHSTGPAIGQIIVNNPKPEPASDSLPRTLRKVSYLSLARGR